MWLLRACLFDRAKQRTTEHQHSTTGTCWCGCCGRVGGCLLLLSAVADTVSSVLHIKASLRPTVVAAHSLIAQHTDGLLRKRVREFQESKRERKRPQIQTHMATQQRTESVLFHRIFAVIHAPTCTHRHPAHNEGGSSSKGPGACARWLIVQKKSRRKEKKSTHSRREEDKGESVERNRKIE